MGCGKLSGSGIGGSQATAANLAKQYANEVKILSCQPDEYSIEGEQWGGGRGAFSYHLLDGLTGMADGDENYEVNLREIRNYLEENVSEEVAPQSQNPMVIGNKTEKLVDVFPEILAQLKEGKKGQLQLFTATESKGIEDNVLAAADSNIVEMYLAFQQALNDKNFLCDVDASETCADYYYAVLSKESQLEKLHSTMRRNYAAALQDDAQQVINRLLISDPDEYEQASKYIQKKYGQYPAQIQRAAELLGTGHYMYNVLTARKFWFDAYLTQANRYSDSPRKKFGLKTIEILKKALSYQNDMPTAYLDIAVIYANHVTQLDSAEYYAEKALSYNPNWTLVHAEMGHFYVKRNMLEDATRWLDRGLAIDSQSVALLHEWSWIYNKKKEYKKEEEILNQILAIDSLASTLSFKGDMLRKAGRYEESEDCLKKALEINSLYDIASLWLLKLYQMTSQFDKEEAFLLTRKQKKKKGSSISSDLVDLYIFTNNSQGLANLLESKKSVSANDYLTIGQAYLKFQKEQDAERTFGTLLKMKPEDAELYKKMGNAYFQQELWGKSIEFLKKAHELQPKDRIVLENLGIANVGLKQYEEAAHYFNKASKANSKRVDADILLAGMHMLLEDYQMAEQILLDLKKTKNNRKSVINAQLGLVYLLNGQDKKSEKHMQKAFSSGKKWEAAAIYGFGIDFFRLHGKYKEAEQMLSLINRYSNTNYLPDFELTKLYARAGELEKAYDSFRATMENDPINNIYSFREDPSIRLLTQDKERFHKEMIEYFPDLTKK